MKQTKKIIYSLAIFFIITKIILVIIIFIYPKIIIEKDVKVSASKLINLTNQYRQQAGLSRLSVNPRLTQAAVNKARDLLSKQYFDHTSPEGNKFSAWIKDVGYEYFYVGENLAIDFENDENIFQAWLNSPTHKANIIKPQYQEIGLAVLSGKFKNHSTIVVVQLFGTRILGADETSYQPPLNLSDNYFYNRNFWQKIIDLKNLETANDINNYLLLIFFGLMIITYKPINQKRKNQINIKQPIINRYQEKIFRE